MNMNEQQRTTTHINGRHSSLTDKHLLDHSAPHSNQRHHRRHHLLTRGHGRLTLNRTLNKLDFICAVCSFITHCGRWLSRAAQLDAISLSGRWLSRAAPLDAISMSGRWLSRAAQLYAISLSGRWLSRAAELDAVSLSGRWMSKLYSSTLLACLVAFISCQS